jgi:hypothetical protein
MVTEAKFGLTSMTELIDRLIKECEVLTQQSQFAQSESKYFLQELDAERERNLPIQQIIRQFSDQSKDRRITELEEKIAQAKRTAQQPSKIVIPATSFQHNRFGENVASDSHLDISQFSTRQPENIPAEDFFIISKDVERTDSVSRIILTNILSQKVDILNRQNKFEDLKIVISEGDEDRRRAASDDIIENLPVEVNCPNLKCYGHALRNASTKCNVQIDRTNPNIPGMTICGKLTNCHQAYMMLVNDGKIWYP